MDTSFVSVKGTALRDKAKLCFIETIVKRILDEFPNVKSLKFDIEFHTFVCNLIENIVVAPKKSKKFNKQEILNDVFIRVFGVITDADKLLIDKNVEYLLANKKIKAQSVFKKVAKCLFSFFQRKFVM